MTMLVKQIGKEREGEQIDRSLLRNVRDIIVEIDMDTMDRYKQDFETPLLDDTATYYRSKATHWIGVDTCTDYMLKASRSMLGYLNCCILSASFNAALFNDVG